MSHYLGFISRRMLRSRFISLAAVLAVAFGVFTLIPVLAVMEGFRTEMRSRIRGSLSHVEVRGRPEMSLTDSAHLESVLQNLILDEALLDAVRSGIGVETALERLRPLTIDLIDANEEYGPAEFLPIRRLPRLEAPERTDAEKELVQLVHRMEWNGQNEALFDVLSIEPTPAVQPVNSTAPFIERFAVYLSGSQPIALELRAIEMDREGDVGDFESYIMTDQERRTLQMDFDARLPKDRTPLTSEEIGARFTQEYRQRVYESTWKEQEKRDLLPPGVLVGIELLRSGQTRIGEVIELSSVRSDNTICKGEFLVVGAFQTGVYQQDFSWMFVELGVAQSFFDLFDPETADFAISGIRAQLHDFTYADAVVAKIDDALAGLDLRAETWEDQRRSLLSAVEVEKNILSGMMMLVVGFAGVVIFLILTVFVIDKTRDLGVLRSLGATRMGVVLIFVRTGMVLCVVGLVFGLIAGYTFTEHLNEVHDFIRAAFGVELFPKEIYYLDSIPVAYLWRDWLLALVPTIVFGFVASLIPAVWAASRDPIRALRHE